MTDLKRLRLLCALRQIDVWAGTGVPIANLSAAERGRKPLDSSEEAVVFAFLKRRWEALQECEARQTRPAQTHGCAIERAVIDAAAHAD